MIRSAFVTGTGTGVGKTTVTTSVVLAARARGLKLVAIKPIETGVVNNRPADAIALGLASQQAELAMNPAFYRAAQPLSPYAAELGGATPLDFDAIVRATRNQLDHGPTLIEGAGGFLVPLTRSHTIADFAAEIGVPLIVVACDRLGVLSDVLTTIEAVRSRRLDVFGVYLNRLPDAVSQSIHSLDPSPETNARILRERLDVPVIERGDQLLELLMV